MAGFFNLHEELVRLQDNEVSFEEECVVPDLDSDQVEGALDELVENLQGDSSYITQPRFWDMARSFVRHFESLNPDASNKFVDLLVSVFDEQIASVKDDLSENAQHNFEQDKYTVEMYTFIWHWLIEVSEGRWRNLRKENEKAAGGAKPKHVIDVKGRGSKAKVSTSAEWNWSAQRLLVLKSAEKLLKLDLDRIIIASSERDMVVNMITKSISLILEDVDAVKDDALKKLIMHVLALCATRYDRGLGHGVQTRVSKEYLREDHLADFVAELMDLLATQYTETALIENVLRESAERVFTDKDLKVAKAYSKFLTTLSMLQPKEVLKQMVHLQVHLDSESYAIRLCMIEVIGNLIHNLLATDNSPSAATSMHAYYDILQERFRDVNSFVRVKLLQVLMKLTEQREDTGLTDIPITTRPMLINLTIGRLHDKSSHVRKNAIKLLARFLQTSPFVAIAQDEGKLSLKYFEGKKKNLEELIKAKFPTELIPGMEDEETGKEVAADDSNKFAKETPNGGEESEQMDVDETLGTVTDPAETDKNNEEPAPLAAPVAEGASEKELKSLRGFLKYYTDGIRFIKQIDSAVPTLCELLASNVKGEVVETMNFFVEAHRYNMDCAQDGICTMVHKIWDKDTGESEVGSIREHLMKSYVQIYFEGGAGSEEASAEVIAGNLIRLTYTMTLAELTSLEQLLSTMMGKGMVPNSVVDTLWKIFGSKKSEMPPQRRRGALTILSYFGKARKAIIADNLELLLRGGLGEFGKKDLQLARNACIALQQLGSTKRQKGSLAPSHDRLPMAHPMFARLRDLILEPVKSLNWFGFAEQAINTIYLLSEHPDILCGELIKRIAGSLFAVRSPDAQIDDVADELAAALNINGDRTQEEDGASSEHPKASSSSDDLLCNPYDLSKLCFVVGHVAIKQIVHLEAIESEWKRKKHTEDTAKTPRRQAAAADELDAVTGTAEDEFAEAIAHIRERELLFGERSLLKTFGPMIAFICSSNRSFKHPTLQVNAVLALCKFMCVSSDFCDAHLQLLFTILEKSSDPIIRSNTIIGLGDMTVSFNSLIDQNISYLYNRLNDTDRNVKKNTLMVLTFLILNGMVKVKGQISEMAKCLEDEEQRISDLAKLFFKELSTKDNAIYNNLPDIISNLSHPEHGVAENSFKDIMKYLLDFIKKDKQTENIVEKLCLRFRNAETSRQWRDISFCLSLLNFTSEKSIKKLVEHLPQYQDKLHEPMVYKHLQDILSKTKKLPKADIKTFIEEFEVKLKELHDKCVENEAAVSAATQEQEKVGKKVSRDGVERAIQAMQDLNLNSSKDRADGSRSGKRTADEDADIGDLIGSTNDSMEVSDEEEDVPLTRTIRPGRQKGAISPMDESDAEDVSLTRAKPSARSSGRKGFQSKSTPTTARGRAVDDDDDDDDD
ncbi:Condensin complex subunit, partial [Borealophlyctis nickersoniae]